MSQLDDYRKSIDLVDEAIISLLAERRRVVEKVGAYKKEQGLSALDAGRWKQVVESRVKMAEEKGLDGALVKGVYEVIHGYALRLEEAI